jgi:hypothetical protein
MHLLIAAMTIAALVPGQAPARGAVLRSVQVVAEPGGTRVVIEAEGRLPVPSVGVLESPPRIYLDFQDVTPRTRGTSAEEDPLVRRVRVALHEQQPVLTRVVIDLTKPAAHELDVSARALGRVVIVAKLPAGSPVTGQPRSQPRQVPRTASPPPAAAAGVLRQRAAASDALGRLHGLRPLLAAIDRRDELPEEQLLAGTEEFGRVRESLTAVRAPGPLASIYEVLTTVCALGVTAADTRLAAQRREDAAAAWNAASAAAGALLLLDRAGAELRSLPTPK